jgi:hypothetical protein
MQAQWRWMLVAMLLAVVACGNGERKPPAAGPRSSATPQAGTADIEGGGAPTDPYVLPSEACAAKAACAETGRCSALKGGAADDCIAGDDARCARSVGCKTKGRCRAQHPTEAQLRAGFTLFSWDCVAVAPEDCQQVEACKHAVCEVRHGSCEAKLAATDCRAAETCKDLGLCAIKDGECGVGTDADCSASKSCRRWGACAAGEQRCEARTAAHCGQSEVCSSQGRCTPDGSGACGHDKRTDCRKFAPCRERGACSLRYVALESGGREAWACVPASAADCRQGDACKLHGECSYVGETKREGSCRVGSDADCKASRDCQDRGACRLVTDEYGNKVCG